MGRRICPENPAGARSALVCGQRRGFAAHVVRAAICVPLLAFGVVSGLVALPAHAQTVNERAEKKSSGEGPDKMFVEANELVYNDKVNTVTAEGNARVYYQGHILEADRVIYNRNTKRVFAEGHAKLTEKDGTITHGDRFDVTDDFRDGFVESLRADTTDKTHFSSPRAERSEGDTTVFDKGTYTACDACKNDPTKPPLWRVRAKRIIHKNEEQMIYYEDAWLEFLGVPVAYVPFLSSPDPTVKRKSGLLSPYLTYRSVAGAGVGVPIFWDLADNYDLTFTPIIYSQEGFFANLQWRHRLENGSYFIKANGIYQLNPQAFGVEPYVAGDIRLRGSIESRGEFQIADQWKVGWAGILLSDKSFLNDYGVQDAELSTNYLAEATSTAYLTGQGNRGYFDLRGYYFQGLTPQDVQQQQPIAHPVWDYNKSFDIDPAKTAGIGGQATLDFNFTSLSASLANYQAVGTRTLDSAYSIYNTCTNYVPGTTTGSCLLRGIGGDYNRLTVDASWKRKYIDPIGEVWTPFAFARGNGELVNLNTTNTFTFATATASSTLSNAPQTNFLGGATDKSFGMFTPGAGIDYRYPFLTKTPLGSTVFEPIAQVIARPNNQLGATSLVNMDAQSLVFDDSTLFQWDKYSGYDRFETGTRANYGGQVTTNFATGGYANLIAGQSYQVAGTNSYKSPDASNVGLSSGLDTRRSDYVASFTLAPNSALAFTAKSRFDVNTFEARRLDLGLTGNFGALTGSIQYANYQSQPVIGYYVRREGLSLDTKYKFTDNYFAQGNITFDMSRHLYPASLIGYTNPGLFPIANLGIGAGYQDECCSLTVKYLYNYYDNGYTLAHNNTVLVELMLRTLGDVKYSQAFNSATGVDGIK
jgi:LPS-assembly protein